MMNESLSNEVIDKACETLRILTHPERLRICQFLLAAPASVRAIEEELDLRQSVVSQHLNHLYARGVVDRERDGRHVIYRVSHPGPAWLLECIANHYEPHAESAPVSEKTSGANARS